MSTIFLTALEDCLSIQKDFHNGQATAESLNEAKKRFAKTLNDIIDLRIKGAFEDRRKASAQEKIDLAEELNSTVKETAQSIHSIQALNSAPAPPDPNDVSSMKEWVSDYQKWYNEKRKKGVSLK